MKKFYILLIALALTAGAAYAQSNDSIERAKQQEALLKQQQKEQQELMKQQQKEQEKLLEEQQKAAKKAQEERMKEQQKLQKEQQAEAEKAAKKEQDRIKREQTKAENKAKAEQKKAEKKRKRQEHYAAWNRHPNFTADPSVSIVTDRRMYTYNSFYNSIGVPIVNAAGNSEISLKSLGQITAPASGVAPIDGKTSNDTNAQGCWYRAAIPAGAATFAVKYGSTTTEQEKIYEKSSKIKRYSNDYTLDGMQYRINGTSATLLYPVFEEDPNYTLDAGGGQVINSNGSTVRVDTTKVSDYANYGAATAEKMNGNITPALYQTTTNDVTYSSGSEY